MEDEETTAATRAVDDAIWSKEAASLSTDHRGHLGSTKSMSRGDEQQQQPSSDASFPLLPRPSNISTGPLLPRKPSLIPQSTEADKERKRLREGEDDEEARKKRMVEKKKKSWRVRWKSGAELVAIRLIHKTHEEEEANLAGLSHQEEGEMLRRKPKALLEWYIPLPLVVPEEYLHRGKVVDAKEPSGGELGKNDKADLDVSAEERELGEKMGERELRQAGLLSQTATIPWPDPIEELERRQSWQHVVNRDDHDQGNGHAREEGQYPPQSYQTGYQAQASRWGGGAGPQADYGDHQWATTPYSPPLRSPQDGSSADWHGTTTGTSAKWVPPSAAPSLPAPKGIRADAGNDSKWDSKKRQGQEARICQYYRKPGGCTMGNKCKFMHI